MATKKREIYARAAVQLRGHERAIKAEKACPGSMGLYLFLLLDSRAEERSGDVDEDVALTSWGAPVAYRRRQIEALIAVGLVERVDGRLHVVKYDEHNDTPADIEAAREAARNRQAARRGHAPVTRDTSVTHADVPISSSISLSGSGSDLEIAREGGPVSAVRPDATGDPPPWWEAVLATVHMQAGVLLPAGESWLRYAGHRAGKGLPASQQDALYWLTSVMVREARDNRDVARRRDEREAKWDKQRAGPGSLTPVGEMTPEQQRALVEAVPMRRRKGAA